MKKLEEAYNFVRDTVADGGEILFVGTKKQASDSIRDEATRCGMHYVNVRWLGGMLTNFKTIKQRIKRLEQLRKMEADGTFELLPKKEVVKLQLEIEKLEKFFGARNLGIPIVAIVDTNCDPDEVDYVIPGNDDAIRAVKLLAGTMANAVLEAKQGQDTLEEAGEEEAPAAEEAAGESAEA